MNIVESRDLDGNPVLAIATGLTPRSLAQSKITASLSSPGRIFRPDGTEEPWIPTGTFCDEQSGKPAMYIYGPAFTGETLLSAVSGTRDYAWKTVHSAISILTKAYLEQKITKESMTAIMSAGPGSILTGSDGTVLVLPSELYIRCVSGHGEAAEIANRMIWIHPDHRTINPSWAFSFMAGTLAYRIAAGVAPFGKTTALDRKMPKSEEIALDMRNDRFEPLEVLVWAIRPAAAVCINSLVSAKVATSTDTLISFGPSIDSIIDPAKEGIPESEEFAAARAAVEKKMLDDTRRKDFYRRHRTTFRIAGIAVLAIVVIVATYINDNKSNPSTLGLQPFEVVAGFYQGVNTLDQEVPREYTLKKVKTGYDELITNLYVTAKVRQSYESNSGIISPAQLYAAGKPENRMIYGLTGLSIRETRLTDTRGEYEARFYYWMPMAAEGYEIKDTGLTEQAADQPSVPAQLSVYAYTDSVIVEYVKDRWMIAGIEQVSRDLVEGDSAALLAKIAADSANDLPYAPTPEEIEASRKKMLEPAY